MERFIAQSLSIICLVLVSLFARGESGRLDYDLDNNGLIEINDLADLNEMRNSLDGTSLYGSSEGCPESGCVGFELTSDLDFDTNGDGRINEEDDFWNDGEGWVPVGSNMTGNQFAAVFNGNGHLIRNLFIHRPRLDHQALFGATDSAVITGVGLTGPLMQVTGDTYSGGLVGSARNSEITGVFSTGKVRSYDAINVLAGGLAGELDNTQVTLAFTAGEVTVDDWYTGGMVSVSRNSTISLSYSTTWMSGARWGGGLVGYGSPENTSASYWAPDISGATFSVGGEAVNLNDLQCPTGANDTACTDVLLYPGWDRTAAGGQIYWDFGDDRQLPALVLYGKRYRDSDGDGVLDESDDFPNDYTAGHDSDGDGAIDAWSPGCDADCRADSDLTLDQFPNNAAASVDLDLDGYPDSWNVGCDDQCQAHSGLTLDDYLDDEDNDGLPDKLDTDLGNDGVVDADSDSNGLIDINSLAQLDAVRHHFSGTGRRLSENGTLDVSGCPAVVHRGVLQRRCRGYELKTDLDFDTNRDGVIDHNDAYWNDGKGWNPIDSGDLEFRAVFNGNGHHIKNVYINRPEESANGLFGYVRNAELKAIGLIGPLTFISGNQSVGTLVGIAENVDITGIFGNGRVVGLEDDGAHTAAGGLIGWARNSRIATIYFSGEVIAHGDDAGGLIGSIEGDSLKYSFSTAKVRSDYHYGALATKSTSLSVSENYWVTGLNDDPYSSVGLSRSLQQLQCATKSNQYQCSGYTVFQSWPTEVDSPDEPHWDFGTETQLPGLVLSGRIYRDSDGDGLIGGDDLLPNDFDNDGVDDAQDDLPFNPAASVDTDGDGRPDGWNPNCDTQCQSDSGLVLDTDWDGDGVDNEADAFPLNSAASVDDDNDGLPDACYGLCGDSGLTLDPYPNDTDNDGVPSDEDAFPLQAEASSDMDGDGRPDRWNDNCNSQCQRESELELDPDIDGDGINNGLDAFPNDFAVSVDADQDGLPDAWNDDCDQVCRETTGLVLDEHLDDTDNDGVVNSNDHYPLDGDRWRDDVPPEMVRVPDTMHVSSQGEYTKVSLNIDEALGIDSFDDSVTLWVYNDEGYLDWHEDNIVELPVGKVALHWVARDSAGNESEPMVQVVNVYPQVRFSESESVSGEGRNALVGVELTGPSPVYPIELRAKWIPIDSTATEDDFVSEGVDGIELDSMTVTIQSDSDRFVTAFSLPVAEDNEPESDRTLVLALEAALAGDSADGSDSRFMMPIDAAGERHTLIITEENRPPSVSLHLEQDGEIVDTVQQGGGEVTIQATITDVNIDDEHRLEWFTGTLPFVVHNDSSRFTFDPMDLDVGEYVVRVEVTDDGNPPLSASSGAFWWTVEAHMSDEEPDEESPEEDSDDDSMEEPDSGQVDPSDSESDGDPGPGSEQPSSGSGSGGGGAPSIAFVFMLSILAFSRLRAQAVSPY